MQYKNRIIRCTRVLNSHLTVHVSPRVSIMAPKCTSKQKVMCVIYPIILIISLTNLPIIKTSIKSLKLWKKNLTFFIITSISSWVLHLHGFSEISQTMFRQKFLSRQFCSIIIKYLALKGFSFLMFTLLQKDISINQPKFEC